MGIDVIDLIVQALEGLPQDGDNFLISDKYQGHVSGKDCLILYSRHASGGSYEGILDVKLEDDKVSLERGDIIIDLADPNSIKKIGEIIVEKASQTQTERTHWSWGKPNPGKVRTERSVKNGRTAAERYRFP
jgi:hypothetical protein